MTGRLRGAVKALFGEPPDSAAKRAAKRARLEKAARAEKEREQERERRAHEREVRLKRLIRIARKRQAAIEASAVHAEDAAVVPLDYAAHEVRLLASSEIERTTRAHSCAREPWTVAWIEESFREGGVLYDIGANVGTFALIAAKVGGGRGTVVAFEPGYASFARLCDNVVLNGCQNVVIPLPIALGSTTGLGTFAYRRLHAGESRHEFTDAAWTAVGADASPHYHQPILSMRLDDVIAQFQVPRPTHIKMDVDGAELKALSGAAATLADSRLRSILVEIDPELTEAVPAMLGSFGFELAARHQRMPSKRTQVWYGEFRRRE